MNSLIEEYINYIYIEKRLSANTKDAYKRDLVSFSTFLDNKKVVNIKSEDIREYIKYLNEQKEKDKTIARKIVNRG